MAEGQCVFCGIAHKQIKSFIVYEDENAVAFLDIMPRSKGMVIVVPKKHYLEFDQDEETTNKIFAVAQKVGNAIKVGLNPLTVYISVMSSQVPHFNIKVYPVYQDEVPLMENQPKQANEQELNTISNVLKTVLSNKVVEEKKNEEEKPKDEKPVEKKKRSKEETYWIKRELDMA